MSKSFIYSLVICMIMPFFNPYLHVKAETDLMTIERYYIGDEYISGHTSVKNARIKVFDGYDSFPSILGAKANEKGDFKLVYKPYNPSAGKDIILEVYDENGDFVDDEIVTMRSERPFQVSPVNTDTENITFSGNSFSRVDLVANDKVIATSSQRNMKAPKLNPGEFLTFNFHLSTGDIVTIKKVVALSKKDLFIYPMSNSSERIKGTVSIPNAHLLYYVGYLPYYFDRNRLIEFYADENGNFNKEKATGGVFPNFYVCVFDPIFDNFIGYGEPEYLSGLQINPITNLSTEISGRATPNQGIEITNLDTKELLGVTTTDDFGFYKLAVSNLVADDFISVRAYSTKTGISISKKTDVQKVYINDINDASEMITGNSSFGTSVTVEVTPPTIQQLSVNVSASKTKIYGPYPIAEGRDFSLKTGRLASGSKVSLTFKKNSEKATMPIMTVKKVLTPAPSKSNAVIVNNKGKADVAKFKNIPVGATIKAYTTKTGGLPVRSLKSTTTSAELVFSQLGKVNGNLYVTVTIPGLIESDRVAISYLGEQSDTISSKQVKTTNNKGKSDIVSVSNIAVSDVIKIYSRTNQLLVSKKVMSGKSISISLKQLGTKTSFMYVTITKSGMLESKKTAISFKGEVTKALSSKKVKITNHKKKSDLISVTNLKKNDLIYVYNSKKKKIASKKATSSSVLIRIKQIGVKKGYVYLTVKSDGMLESSKVKVYFKSE
ncbi:hypothetical protein [Neobacillus sp. SuZ13]|uniref:hypothetical protein n=1 Tax=Neobacillus sp. SuZ13 TaxID=3047875 RepID=UPI0024C0BA03|nr:hypothetical protein [Neobacillus sp. SuZ13]WHY66870.1 hypothetical protein QNH17_28435 [Neobacillus sp. SuZ13]